METSVSQLGPSTIPTNRQLRALLKPPPAESLAPAPTWEAKKTDVRDFIAKKREIFLVLMTIDNKKQELSKLQERADLREEAVSKGEQMLAEDAAKFDAFLRENDEKLQQAKRAVEAEVKGKQDKIAEIKKLGALAAVARSELNDVEDQLEQCKGYRDFLDRITPQDWFKEEQAKKDLVRAEELATWAAACEGIRSRRAVAAAAQAQAEESYANARTQQEAEAAEALIARHKAALALAIAEQEPPEPPPPPPDDEPKMFFTEPHQLLQSYARLEEENLFLIQATQEAEEAYESAREALQRTQTSMGAQADALSAQVAELAQAVQAAQLHCQALKADGRRMGFSGSRPPTALLTSKSTLGKSGLNLPLTHRTGTSARPGTQSSSNGAEAVVAKLREVHSQCGFEGDSGLTSVQMLASLESRLEELLAAADQLSPEAMAAGQRAREAERRKAMREEKALKTAQEHDERERRAKERADAPIFKKTEKPAMTRSLLPVHVKVKNMTLKDVENQELDRFLSQDLTQL
ncbi:hypothetical protein WJX73_002693 [Symbiochloris irregularis]|uniref:DUF4200 domain-containing protein n=1 Tax=Symbiochloris irregularis TaxID=706552 RepID=A0AAW1P1C0_9CHLO